MRNNKAHEWKARGWRKMLLAGLLLGAVCLQRSQTAALAAGAGGAAAIADAINRLPVVGSVLLVGAHPDDENSTLLPYLARGMHVRAAYLSATRGDGGQNLIGDEQYEALGILRTEELLAARRIDGAEQFFGEEYDFGFSKSADEAMQKWGHDEALGDFVRIVRRYRPDVLIARFSGTPADGHGHHQASGILTREAFRAAADPKRFPEQLQEGLKPWQPAKLFQNLFSRGGPSPATRDTFSLNLDGFDPVFGKTFPEIGAEARSQHRSQGMGTGARRGNEFASFKLLDSVAPLTGSVQGLFDGVDLTLNRFTTLAGGSPEVGSRVQKIIQDIQEAQHGLSPYQPGSVIGSLAHGLRLLREVRSEIEKSQVAADAKDQSLFLLKLKEADFVQAIMLAGGVRLDALADRAEITPGETFNITVSAVARVADRVKIADATLKGPAGWKVERVSPPGTSGPNIEAKFRVTVPIDAPVSQPYWLVNARAKDRFNVSIAPWNGDPQNPPLFSGSLQFAAADDAGAVPLEQGSGAVYRFADRIYGEREKPLVVVPAVGVWLEPPATVFPSSMTGTQPLLLKVRSNRAAKQQVTLRLNLAGGWRTNPPSKLVDLGARGDEVSVRLDASPPATPMKDKVEEHPTPAVAEVDGQSYSTGYQVIDYPHIQTRYLFHPAVTKLERFEVKVAQGLRIGYVMGTGDSVPEALRLLGAIVNPLTAEDLAAGNLGRFDAIMTGIRAYEVRKDLIANHSRLMDYVRNGGLMIVQYSRAVGDSAPLGPYPMNNSSGARVDEEEAPVEVLEPVDPFFQEPNRISDDDFKGWVQERGLYFMDTWAPEYRPLLSSHDTGEPPLKGGMLLASYGKGLYLYTAYVWNRQLPAGVPGAYRILANMISLGKSRAATPGARTPPPPPAR